MSDIARHVGMIQSTVYTILCKHEPVVESVGPTNFFAVAYDLQIQHNKFENLERHLGCGLRNRIRKTCHYHIDSSNKGLKLG